MKPVLFLDFDGVLNTPKTWGSWRNARKPIVPIEDHLLENVRTLVDMFDMLVVISSTWRNVMDRDDIIKALDTVGARLYPDELAWKTDFVGDHRGRQIERWLDARPCAHLILDDDSDFLPGQNPIKTDYKVGFSEEAMNKAIRKLRSILA